MTITAECLLNSAEYFPLQFDGPDLVFVRMTRQNYHDSIFTMPGRISPATNEQWKVPFSQVVGLVQAGGLDMVSPSFIFQIAHCGSTLLSRALDVPGTNLVIREPLVLRQLAATPKATSPAQRDSRQQALGVLLFLLTRQFDQHSPVLIKGNVPVNFCIPEMMERQPGLRGVLLYSELDDYLVSILKSEQRQAWARYVTTELFAQIQAALPVKLPAAESLSAVQAGAVLWHAQMHLFSDAISGNDRLQLLHSQQLFNQPEQTLINANRCLCTGLRNDQIKTQLNSDLFKRDAKQPDKAYSAQQRETDLQKLIELHQKEIEQGIIWSTSLELGENLHLPEARHL